MESETTVTAMADYRPQLHPCTIEAYYQPTHQNTNSRSTSSFLCGTYELHEGKEGEASRGGSITVCTIDSSSKTLCHRTTDCKSGVLDMKISGDFVAAALSQNSLSLHQIHDVDCGESFGDSGDIQQSLIVEEVATVSAENEGLFLSLDWDLGYMLHALHSQEEEHGDEVSCKYEEPEKFVRRCAINEAGNQSANIAVSTQEGSIIVYHLSGDKEFSEIFHVSEAHKMTGVAMPVWIVCFDPHSKSTLVTGGDDCIMKLWDIRHGNTPTHTNKNHNAGVTSAQWHPTIEHTFITGSYDEYVRIWDQRSLRSPVSETHTGGGVWRTKWNLVNEKSSILSLSCMQGGSAIVEYNHDSSTCTLRAKHGGIDNDNHLAYGIDIINAIPAPSKSAQSNPESQVADNSLLKKPVRFTVASCSFYENIVQVWNVDL